MRHGHVCSFEGVPNAQEAYRTGGYVAFKEAVLEAGRFSAFEASANDKMAKLYTALCRDPEVETDISGGYPWTKVRRRTAPSA